MTGADKDKIIGAIENLHTNKDLYVKMSSISNPYGDGKAADRILKLTKDFFAL